MLNSIWRIIDLGFVFSQRARDACLAAQATGIPVETMYDGGLEVKAAHMRPEFKTGRPTVVGNELFVVGETVDHDAISTQRLRYDPNTDSWFGENGRSNRPRTDTDLWIPEREYPASFKRAASRAADASA